MDARLLALGLDGVAAYRLTKLLTDDVIAEAPRERIIEYAYEKADPPHEILIDEREKWSMQVERDPDPPKLATLVTCRWCVGVYVAAGVLAARRLAPRPWSLAAEGLALAAAAALIAGLEDD